jgi:hypothetical protein
MAALGRFQVGSQGQAGHAEMAFIGVRISWLKLARKSTWPRLPPPPAPRLGQFALDDLALADVRPMAAAMLSWALPASVPRQAVPSPTRPGLALWASALAPGRSAAAPAGRAR